MGDRDTDLDQLEFISVRTSLRLRQMGYSNLEQLRNIPQSQLLKHPGFGRKSLNEVINLMKEHNIVPDANFAHRCISHTKLMREYLDSGRLDLLKIEVMLFSEAVDDFATSNGIHLGP